MTMISTMTFSMMTIRYKNRADRISEERGRLETDLGKRKGDWPAFLLQSQMRPHGKFSNIYRKKREKVCRNSVMHY